MLQQVKVSTTGPRDVATFAGGDFHEVQYAFEQVPGVVSVVAGFAQGLNKEPTYEVKKIRPSISTI